ncbi:MATE family efflux transporter [Tritonibacter mobilis]|uniref:polysaccharide biosynthesis C-terminal domain-containing protein n=1 Tax=Tritonibacter mobilis TaxID=379347 RepID=UPI000E0DEE16|nr:polysaccharide biosynthesis C-terminal domain-containing protein [Tritonibacter mobilis]
MALLTVSASKAGVAVLALASAAIVAHVYGQLGLGIFALLRVAPAVFMAVTDPGFSHAVPYLSANRNVGSQSLIGSSILVYLVVGTVQISFWLLLSPLIHEHLLPPLPLGAIYLAALLVPMQSIMILIVNLLRSRLRYNLANGVFLIAEIALVLLTGASAIWFDNGPEALVVLITLSSGIALLMGIVFLIGSGVQGAPYTDKAVVTEGVMFGIKSQIGNAFQILNYRLDHLLLGFFLTPEKVAVYFVATKSVEFFRFFTASIVFVFEPIFAAQVKNDAKARVQKMIVPLLLANLVLLVVGVLIAPLLYPLVFGEWSTDAQVPLYILAIGLAISGANTLFGAFFLGQGHPEITTVASLAGLIATVVSALILIPTLEIIGAAISSSLAYSFVTITYLAVFFRIAGNLEHRGAK